MQKTLNILVVGSGAREHALAWKIAQSPRLKMLYIAPGNGGTRLVGENVPILATDIAALIDFAKEKRIDLTVIGPDDPLALGIVDAFQAAGLTAFGFTKAAAKVEASKAFAKEVMSSAHIPTAEFAIFSDFAAAKRYAKNRKMPLVVKASGLAQGKGVAVCHDLREVEDTLRRLLVDKALGSAGEEVVIETFIPGPEVVTHALWDGKESIMFPAAQPYKPVYDGNIGPMSGGMGSYAPVRSVSAAILKHIQLTIVNPTLLELSRRGLKPTGCLFPNLKGEHGHFKVLEFNARFGDPASQPYMRLLQTDLLDLIEACLEGELRDVEIKWRKGYAVSVVLASEGYPTKPITGRVIEGIAEAEQDPEVVVFHAGTVFEDGRYVTSGGRVLGVSAIGKTLTEATLRAYVAVEKIRFEGMHYRKDIGRPKTQKSS